MCANELIVSWCWNFGNIAQFFPSSHLITCSNFQRNPIARNVWSLVHLATWHLSRYENLFHHQMSTWFHHRFVLLTGFKARKTKEWHKKVSERLIFISQRSVWTNLRKIFRFQFEFCALSQPCPHSNRKKMESPSSEALDWLSFVYNPLKEVLPRRETVRKSQASTIYGTLSKECETVSLVRVHSLCDFVIFANNK